MPISKRRKKKGKPVGNGVEKNRQQVNQGLENLADRESGVTLQDLINALAYQESKNAIHIPDTNDTEGEKS